MADGFSLELTSCVDANVDDGKGITMNGMATGNVSADGPSRGMASNSSLKMPHVGDTDIDGGMGIEINGTAVENDKTTQEMPNDPKECPRDGGKEVIVLDDDDHANDAKKNIKDELDCNPSINGRNEKTPQMGMVFTSYDELNNYFKQYALRVGFGVAVKKSSFTKKGVCRRLVLACSKGGTGRADAMYQARRTAKTNCEVMISAKSRGDGLLHLVEVKLEHNHPVNPSTARFMRCYKRMATSIEEDLAEQPSGDNNVQLAENKCGNATEIGKLKLAEGDDEAIHQFFASMQNKNPNFFYLIDLDQHGRLKNLFWADARCRAAYQYFGDVVTLDTTCLTDKYDLPLVSFVGMNHHGQLVLLGCGLVSDETTETYVWLFKAWQTCMLGCLLPNAIITDQCKSIQHVVAEVLPDTRHRLCLSYVLKKIPDKLRGLAEFKEVKKAIKKMAYDSLRVEEFEVNWEKMIEAYGLESNDWLKTLYEDRHSWVPVFLKNDTFWAGMSVSQRGETVTSFFDGCVYPRTSIKQFLSKCEMTLLSKFKKEVQNDSESFHKTPLIISKFYMEEQLSKVYTLNMFKKFQDELKATMYCHVTPVKVDGSIITFEIKECSYIEDGKRTESKDHEVLFNVDEVVVQCICGFFSFHGVLCRHVLSVFKFQQIYEIPSHYILDRWRKDFKRLHASRFSNDTLASVVSERYDYLSMRFLQLVDIGFISEDRYQLSLKLLRGLEKSLLDDTSGRDRQPKLMCFDAQANQNVQNLLASQTGFSEGNLNHNSNSMPMKRRGRPPKKGRESNIESLVRTNREQDFLRSAVIPNEDNVLQATSAVSHLDAHIGQGGIDLMEDLNPTDLSFGTHFDLHINQQHHMSNQQRLQPTNLLQGQYDQQTQNGLPWIYQHILQEDQMPKVPPVRRTG